jgi:hypothetical protein
VPLGLRLGGRVGAVGFVVGEAAPVLRRGPEGVGVQRAGLLEEDVGVAGGGRRVGAHAVGETAGVVLADLPGPGCRGGVGELAQRDTEPYQRGEVGAAGAGAVPDPRRRGRGAVGAPRAALLELGQHRRRMGGGHVHEQGRREAPGGELIVCQVNRID